MFLSLSPIDIWGHKILCCGGLFCVPEDVRVIPSQCLPTSNVTTKYVSRHYRRSLGAEHHLGCESVGLMVAVEVGLKPTVFTVDERSSRAKDEGLSSASYVFGLKSWLMASDYFRLLTLVSLAPVPVLGTVQPLLMSNHPTILLLFLPPLLQVQLQCHLEVFSNQPTTGDLFPVNFYSTVSYCP